MCSNKFIIAVILLHMSMGYSLIQQHKRMTISAPHYIPKYNSIRCASTVISTDSVSNDTKRSNNKHNPIDKMITNLDILWRFGRPHTIIGSGISVLCLYMFAISPSMWFTHRFWHSISSSVLPAVLMNIYITGLNQVTDIEIDKINKKYLPIAAGELSKSNGISIIVACLILSVYIARNALWPLKLTLYGSAFLGTIYSLPPFRLKRYPLLAAFSILCVRGCIVNLGFFFNAKMQILGEVLQPYQLIDACIKYPQSIGLTLFFAIFSIVIAIMKDTPDVEGDKSHNIPSFSVLLGANTMFK